MKRVITALLFLFFFSIPSFATERPHWMDEEGIVMAGSWEAPAFRARRAGYKNFKMPPEWFPGYKLEHSRKMIDSLNAIGVNFIMTHGYKGYGFNIERQGMQDAVRFSNLAHEAGLRVGAYIGSTLGWETLFQEMPEARDWLYLGPNGQPALYSKKQPHRYLAMKNHPGYKNYIKKAIKFAIEEMHADLIHLDNTSQIGIGWDETSIKQFREFLKKHKRSYSRSATPPIDASSSDPQLWRDWIEFRCEAIEQYYSELASYVKSLNNECAIDINPQGFSRRLVLRGIDHGRLLRHGHAFWDESFSTGWVNDKPKTRIRTLKIGQSFDNSVFMYSETPLDVAEMMAYNVNCLGCICWFQGGELQSGHVGRLGKFPRNILPYVQFFHQHHDYYKHSYPVADVALLLDFETIAFAPKEEAEALLNIENKLQTLRIPYAIIFSQQESQFDSYPAIIAAPHYKFHDYNGLVLRSNDPQLETRLLSLSRIHINAPSSVLIELKQQHQSRRWLLHLVNYDAKNEIKDIKINLRLPEKIKKIQALDPLQTVGQNIAFTMHGSEVEFTIPQLHVYKLVVIE